MNSLVGSFDLEYRNKKEFAEIFEDLINSEFIQLCFILKGSNSKIESAVSKVLSNHNKQEIYALFYNHDSLNIFERLKTMCNINYLFISESSMIRRNSVPNRILLRDRFNKCDRNSDYAENTDEFFSEDHLYFSEDKFYGFGDYSTIGDDYSESGFVPYAVAIHMVYYDEDNSLRIHHFVSDNNESREDTPKKFEQAISKLCLFEPLKKYETYAYKEFIHYKNSEQYPGLGTVKKLSVMHHLELVSLFLDGKLK